MAFPASPNVGDKHTEGTITWIYQSDSFTGTNSWVKDEGVGGTGAAPAVFTSSGAQDTIINTNDGTNSGEIKITDGTNGNIDLTPNGTGKTNVKNLVATTAKISDLTDNRVVIAGTGGELEDDANFTFDATTLRVGTAASGFDVTVASGNTHTDGNLGVDGNTTLGSATSNTITATARFSSDVTPSVTNDHNLGTSTLEWKQLHLSESADIGNIKITGNTISSTDTNGNINITPNGTGTVNITGGTGGTVTNTGDFLPSANGTYDLGSSTQEWQDLWIHGTANIDSLIADTARITDLTDNRIVIVGPNGELEDDANFTFNGATLTADASTVFGATAGADTHTLHGDITANHKLNVKGAVDFDTTLNVDGNTTLGGTLNVTGTSTLVGNVSMTNDLTVSGDLTINGTTTTINTTDLKVKDKVVVIAEGATTAAAADDSGIDIGTVANFRWDKDSNVAGLGNGEFVFSHPIAGGSNFGGSVASVVATTAPISHTTNATSGITTITHDNKTARNFDTTAAALTGMNVFDKVDIDFTSDTFGHVTAASGSIQSRDLTQPVRGVISATGDIAYNNTTGVVSYTHPTFAGDDINVDTGVLTGLTVISDLDFNVATNTDGHVTDANGSVATRDLTQPVRGAISATGDLAYNNTTGVVSYTHPTFAGDDISIDTTALTGLTVISDLDFNITTNTDGHVTDANGSVATRDLTAPVRGAISVTDSGGDGSLSYNSGTGVITYTGPSAAQARAHISVNDAGGDGSLAYNSSTGVLTYTGPSAAEVRAHLSAGEGIDFSSGVISGENATTTNKGIASFNTNDFTVSSGAVTVKDSGINHDATTNFVANEHINHTSVSVTAGSGLTGGGTIAATRTLNVGEGNGIAVAADTVSVNAVANGGITVAAGGISVDESNVDHDALNNFVANEHINHTSVSITAGDGLTGGGTIAATRTINVESDLRGVMWTMGRDNNDYYTVGTTTHSWFLNGNEDMRLSAGGALHANGDVCAFSTTIASDVKLKENIKTIEDHWDILNGIRGVTYDMKKTGLASAGVIAQEVEEVMPQAVKYNEVADHKVVDYNQLIGVLIQAVKDLQEEVKQLKGE